MKLRTRAMAYGIAGLVLAGAVIFSGSALGLLNASSSGVLSVLLADPPSVPDGVSAVYLAYSGIAVHAEGFGNNSGWVSIPGQGTINSTELFSLNLSQTISNAVVPSLTYNLVALDITGASVDFMGINYSATVNTGRLTVPFEGGLKVNSSSLAAGLIDIQPTILNLGTPSNPNFTLAAGAKALQVPSGDVNDSLKTVGHTFELEGRGWFESFNARHPDSVASSVPTLTADSLSFSVTNSGSDPIVVRMVMVTPASSGGKERGAFDSVGSNAVFTVAPGGSLTLLNGATGQINSIFGESGFTLAPGATYQFSYSGTIATMFGDQITRGTSYYVVVLGAETLSIQTVVAS